MNRREFLKGASLGVGAGALGAMGLYSYTPMRKAFLPEIDRKMADTREILFFYTSGYKVMNGVTQRCRSAYLLTLANANGSFF